MFYTGEISFLGGVTISNVHQDYFNPTKEYGSYDVRPSTVTVNFWMTRI